MDNLTHTLVGVTIGKAGLARRTPMAMAALVIGANLADVDILGLFFGQNLGFRRGITHGVLALAVWPFILTGLLLAWDQYRRRHDADRPQPVAGQLLLVSAVALVSHPLLDWFNSYGMRWLMPFSGTWFYGDTWFIIDPWVWGTLLVVLWLGRGRPGHPRRAGPAQVGLGLLAVYAVGMWLGSWAGERMVRRELTTLGFGEPRAVMVAPVRINPFVRDVLIDDGRVYRRTTLAPGRPFALPAEAVIEPGLDAVDLAAVAADPQGGQFLNWARFPFARVEQVGDTTVVTLDEARYTGAAGRSFARTEVRLLPRP
ncbi:MAG TPA: metal-dependent hydrolase [Gemmatimonadales bacterium]|nr:metal-dependent hydrolase [Gemmatimonadales bacterium]